jgi:hypothetical protein
MIGKQLHTNGYKMQTYYLTKSQGKKHYAYEYSIFNERVDTFTFRSLKALNEFTNNQKEFGFYIAEWGK